MAKGVKQQSGAPQSKSPAQDRAVGITPNRGAVIRLVGALPAAAVDRCMHDAHLVVTKGDSYRFAQARDGKGVTLLT